MKKVFSPVLISVEQGDRRLFVSRESFVRKLKLEHLVNDNKLNIRHGTGPVSRNKGRWKSDPNGLWVGNYALIFSGDFEETYKWYLMALSTMNNDGVIIEPTDIRPPDPRLAGFPAVSAPDVWCVRSLIWRWN
jgi:hypothetical protein